jgi:methionyl-tRNA formyltransferase
MNDVKIILIGRGTIAVNYLNILCHNGYFPVGIICDMNDDGTDTWTKSLFKRAKALGYKEGVSVFKNRRVNSEEFIKMLKQRFPDIDIIFSVQPYAIFQMPFIKLAKRYVVNLHFAPLPKLRGVAPCSWAFIDGLKTMGVTLHLIEDTGIDNGPIIAQKTFPITEVDTAWTLFNKCVTFGTALFTKHMTRIIQGNFTAKKQNEKIFTYHSKHEFDFDDMEIDPGGTADTVLAFARARIFPPFQLPYVRVNNTRLYITHIQKVAFSGRTQRKPRVWTDNHTCYMRFKTKELQMKYTVRV